jgi:hypothetical protein
VDAGVAINKIIKGYALQPNRVYKDTCDVEARNNVNVIDIGAFEYNAPSATEEIQENKLHVYPNPTSGMIHITPNGEHIKRIKIYNKAGVLLQEHITTDFSVEHLASGVYFIIVQTDKATYSNKIIKT